MWFWMSDFLSAPYCYMRTSSVISGCVLVPRRDSHRNHLSHLTYYGNSVSYWYDRKSVSGSQKVGQKNDSKAPAWCYVMWPLRCYLPRNEYIDSVFFMPSPPWWLNEKINEWKFIYIAHEKLPHKTLRVHSARYTQCIHVSSCKLKLPNDIHTKKYK